jgi:hypothetical protein
MRLTTGVFVKLVLGPGPSFGVVHELHSKVRGTKFICGPHGTVLLVTVAEPA